MSDALGIGSQGRWGLYYPSAPNLSVYPPEDKPAKAVLYGPKGEKLYKKSPTFGYRIKGSDE